MSDMRNPINPPQDPDTPTDLRAITEFDLPAAPDDVKVPTCGICGELKYETDWESDTYMCAHCDERNQHCGGNKCEICYGGLAGWLK